MSGIQKLINPLNGFSVLHFVELNPDLNKFDTVVVAKMQPDL